MDVLLLLCASDVQKHFPSLLGDLRLVRLRSAALPLLLVLVHFRAQVDLNHEFALLLLAFLFSFPFIRRLCLLIVADQDSLNVRLILHFWSNSFELENG